MTATHTNPASVGRGRAIRQASRVSYRVFGDRTDGTYLSVDTTHAHINMPAALMWAAGWRSARSRFSFEPPAGAAWRVATQLFPGADARTFTAPNLQYLMDSPSEFSAFSLRDVHGGRRIAHADVPARDAPRRAPTRSSTRFARDVEKIVREERGVFGEFAPYDGSTYTFIARLPAVGQRRRDGAPQQHDHHLVRVASAPIARTCSSTSRTSSFTRGTSSASGRSRSSRSTSTKSNMSGELWLAEGFTNYYGPLVLQRAGLTRLCGVRRGRWRRRSTPSSSAPAGRSARRRR